MAYGSSPSITGSFEDYDKFVLENEEEIGENDYQSWALGSFELHMNP